jgi:hypothetical protein
MTVMKRLFPLGLVIVGALLSVTALKQLYLSNRASSSKTINLPDELVGLRMTDSKSGAEAVSDFGDLHGKEFPITSGAVATYGNNQATLWIASTTSNSVAAELTSAMQAKIAEGETPFTPTNEMKVGTRTVYALEGMGQKHFYFQSENLVIWLAAEPAIANNALQQTLEVYP